MQRTDFVVRGMLVKRMIRLRVYDTRTTKERVVGKMPRSPDVIKIQGDHLHLSTHRVPIQGNGNHNGKLKEVHRAVRGGE